MELEEWRHTHKTQEYPAGNLRVRSILVTHLSARYYNFLIVKCCSTNLSPRPCMVNLQPAFRLQARIITHQPQTAFWYKIIKKTMCFKLLDANCVLSNLNLISLIKVGIPITALWKRPSAILNENKVFLTCGISCDVPAANHHGVFRVLTPLIMWAPGQDALTFRQLALVPWTCQFYNPVRNLAIRWDFWCIIRKLVCSSLGEAKLPARHKRVFWTPIALAGQTPEAIVVYQQGASIRIRFWHDPDMPLLGVICGKQTCSCKCSVGEIMRYCKRYCLHNH